MKNTRVLWKPIWKLDILDTNCKPVQVAPWQMGLAPSSPWPWKELGDKKKNKPLTIL